MVDNLIKSPIFNIYSPPDPHQNASKWFLGTDMLQNLAYIGAIPQGGIEQVRVHWLFDAVKISRYGL